MLVERVREPEVTDVFAELAPDHAAAFREGPPNFLCLRFLKPANVT
ncbi:hypothetical protein ACFQL4_22095 [Halosimplex aquaticum]